jgi:FKBP-type peptidyl-prolyl cis-trans isomerase
MRGLVLVVVVQIVSLGCQKSEEAKPGKQDVPHVGSGSALNFKVPPKTEQVTPSFDLKNPPADAVKTASGLIYKKLVTNDAGQAPKRNDTVMINYTGWRQTTGETFFTNKTRGQPMPLNLSTTAPGFTEAMQLLKKGEKAMLWVPPAIGYKGSPQGTPETLVYEVEVVDIKPAPAIPPDVANPPDTAEKTKGGLPFVVIRAGTGKDKAHPYDNVSFNYSAWDTEGRMFDSTEMRNRPAKVPPYRQSPAFAEILTTMTAGERVRFWTPAEKMMMGGKPMPGMPQGQLCYEVEILQIEKGIEPPAVPADVAKPPGDVKKTGKGVSYKVLKAGPGGPHPKASDTVRVHYTGWTTDGKMFDSSVTRGEPAEFSLGGVIAGWTDGIPVMSVGDKVRFWIPEELAYKGAPGKPQGMLVFDVELLEIKAPASPDHPPPHPHPHP